MAQGERDDAAFPAADAHGGAAERGPSDLPAQSFRLRAARSTSFTVPNPQLGRQTGSQYLAILDFDQTLAASEVSFFDADTSDVVEEVFGGATRYERLSAFMIDTISRGVLLAIVSFNSAGVIKQVLHAAGWTEHFGDRVYGRDEVHRYNSSKAACISHELIKPLHLTAQDVIFVDDDAHNCRAVLQLGAKVVHVNHRGGMGEAEVAAVSVWLEQRSRSFGRSSFTNAICSLARQVNSRLKLNGGQDLPV
ncbi:hypothetical protein KFE25_000852 [Diacronema lutheri]|uniref:Uncharacterized protein n=1 Tax=Diacronema lutheri TaxID=2081491 RepID=A0A8J5XR68_DIALT|nr:hypothetical protein KFE25_000852 [Diacronema lutheri]